MAIDFSYTENTGLFRVTGGTEGTPATLASCVTADRAGQADLLPVTASTLNMTLTYQIRPVEDLALQISFILAGTSAGAGDTLDITGTDWRGAAQVESINVAAGNGTYTGAKYWRTITDIDCTGWADGTLQVTQPRWGVMWDYGNGNYKAICDYFSIGDNSTPTYFTSKDGEYFYFDELGSDKVRVLVFGATLQLGEMVDGQPINGATWDILVDRETAYGLTYNENSHFKMYDSKLIVNRDLDTNCRIDHLIMRHSIIVGPIGVQRNLELASSIDIKNQIYFVGFGATPRLSVTPDFFEDVHINETRKGIQCSTHTTITVRNPRVTNYIDSDYYVHFSDDQINVVDPVSPVTLPVINSDGGIIQQQHSCNIHIADKDGVNLANVVVDCEDQFGNPVWAAGTITTNAGGDIAGQIITWKQWIDIAKTLTTYSSHKFTISKAGYETMVLDEITVDVPIVWHLELLDELPASDVRDGVPYGEDSVGNLELPAVGDVEEGEGYGSNGVEFTGTFGVPPVEDVRDGEGYGAGDVEFTGVLDLPVEADVEDGVVYDNTTREGTFEAPPEDDVEDGVFYGTGGEFEGNLEIPSEADVRDGEGYGANGIEHEGVLDLPSEDDVEDGVKFDDETKEGNFEAPAEEDVEVGVGYGALGSEFTGTYLGLSGNNLIGYLQKSVELVGYLEKKVTLTGVLI